MQRRAVPRPRLGLVTLRIADQELDIFFDTLLNHAMGSDPVADTERCDIDDHIRALPVHGVLLLSERPFAMGEPVAGHSRLTAWVVEGCEYSEVDDQVVVATHAALGRRRDYHADLVAAREHLRDRLGHIGANPSPLRQLDAMVRGRRTPNEEPAVNAAAAPSRRPRS